MRRKLAFILAATMAVNPAAAFAEQGDIELNEYTDNENEAVLIAEEDCEEEIIEESTDIEEADDLEDIEEASEVEEVSEDLAGWMDITEDPEYLVEDIDLTEDADAQDDDFFNAILAADAITAQVIFDKDFVYDGSPITEEKVLASARLLVDGTRKLEGTMKSAPETGKYYVDSITPKSGSAGNAGEEYDIVFKMDGVVIAQATASIAKADLKDLTLTGATETVVYDGTSKTPEFTSVSDAVLGVLPAESYEIGSYKNNTNAGDTAAATITAKPDSASFVNNFTGTGDVLFTIQPATLGASTNLIINQVASVPYNGEIQTPDIDLMATFTDTYGAKTIPAADYKVKYVTPDSKDAGTYNVTIEPSDTGNLTGIGPEKAGYTITALDLSKATVEKLKDIPAGTDMTDPVNLKEYLKVTSGIDLEAGTDYTASYKTDKHDVVGVPTVLTIAPASGNTENTKDFTYTAVAKDMEAKYTSSAPFTYTGSELRPEAAALGALTADNGSLAVEDYNVVSWSNNINAGTATATIEGSRAYEKKTSTVEFVIQPRNISSYTAQLEAEEGDYYVGAPVAGTVTLSGNGETITPTAADYTLTAAAVEGGYLTAATLEGKGNYTGTVNITGLHVKSNVVTLTGAQITGTIPAGLDAYDEDAVKENITVTAGDTPIAKTAYNVTNINKSDSKVSFKIVPADGSGLSGAADGSVDITPYDLGAQENFAVVLADGANVYTGEALEPDIVSVSVPGVHGNISLTPNDYTVSYSNNTDAGEATVTITGKGNFKNSLSSTFTIRKATLTDNDFTIADPDETLRQFKTGAPADLSANMEVKAAKGKHYVFEAADYTITQDKLPVKTANGAKAEIEATDSVSDLQVGYSFNITKDSKNYEPGTFAFSYPVVKREVKEADKALTLETAEAGYKPGEITVYDASALKPKVTVDGTELKEGTDYTLSVAGTNKVDSERTKEDTTPYVEAVFQGNYSGTAKAEFSITPATADLANVKLVAPKDAVYTGSPVEVQDNYIGSGTAPVKGTEYTVEYAKDGKALDSAPTDAGTYTATVKATPGFGGGTGDSITYTIAKKPLEKAEFDSKVSALALEDVTYEGANTKAPVISESSPDASEFEVKDFEKEWDGKTRKGKAIVALKESSNYAYDGTGEASFTWKKAAAEDMGAFYELETAVYNGQEQAPALKVKEGSDVSLDWITKTEYSGDRLKAGDKGIVDVTITVPETAATYPAGAVTFTKEFTVEKADISNAKVEAIADQVYTGAALRPTVTVESASGTLLAFGTDYSLKYENNTEIGTATVTIEGMGNYKGTTSATFRIIEKEETQKAKAELDKALADAKAAAPGTDDKTRALNNLKNAIAKAEAAEVDQATVDAAKTECAKEEAENQEAAKDAAEKAAEKAKENPTAENIAAADKAIAAAKAAGADTKQAEADRETAADNKKKAEEAEQKKKDDAAKKAFTDAADAVPSKVKESDRAAVEAAQKKYNTLTAAQKKDPAVKAAKEKIDAAKKALDKPTLKFKKAKIRKSLNKARTKTKRIRIKKGSKLKVKASSSTGSKVKYKSNKPGVARVNKNGAVTAKKKGKATITVSSKGTKVKVLIRVK